MSKDSSRLRCWIVLALAVTATNTALGQQLAGPRTERIPLTDPVPVALAPPATNSGSSSNNEKAVSVLNSSELRELPSISQLESVPSLSDIKESESSKELSNGVLKDAQLIDNTADIVRQRFLNGQIQVERSVTLDAEGNYVNDGLYQEWDASGQLIASGEFQVGKREGNWFRLYKGDESSLFKAYPYAELKAPFRSEANFAMGVMTGTWKIVDADGRTASEIQVALGQRQGKATWFHPTGQVMYQAEYLNGILHGEMIEFDQHGTEVRRSEFVNGQRLENVVEKYDNGQSKFAYVQLGSPQEIKQLDQWWEAEPAKYAASGTGIKQGPFTSWHENGQVRSKGTYENGVLVGAFSSWFSNGQRESSGEYQNGLPSGAWTWWHDNGMKRATGEYVDGKPTGTWMNWEPDGKRMRSSKSQSVLTHDEPVLPRGRYSVTRSRSNR